MFAARRGSNKTGNSNNYSINYGNNNNDGNDIYGNDIDSIQKNIIPYSPKQNGNNESDPFYQALRGFPNNGVTPQELLQLLNNNPAVASTTNINAEYPLCMALRNCAPIEVINELLRLNPQAASVQSANFLNRYPLHIALKKFPECPVEDKTELIKIIMQIFSLFPTAASQPCYQVRDTFYPLHLALMIKWMPPDIIMQLLNTYPEAIKLISKNGELAIHIALENSFPLDVIRALISAYPDGLNKKDKNGYLPLNYAQYFYQNSPDYQSVIQLVTPPPQPVQPPQKPSFLSRITPWLRGGKRRTRTRSKTHKRRKTQRKRNK
jgi:hypothetical protein